MHGKKEFVKLASDFRDCRDVLIALGDENRLHLLGNIFDDCMNEAISRVRN